MLLASMDHAEADAVWRRLVGVKNDAEAVLVAAEKRLPDAFRLLPEPDARKIEQHINELRTALKTEHIESIQRASSHLNQASIRLAELLFKDVIAQSVDGNQ